MVSMGKYGGTFVRSNSHGTTAITFGNRTAQNNGANGIFGQQNGKGSNGNSNGVGMFSAKSSVSDIRRMLSRDSQSTQTQAANSWGQNSIVTSTLSYSESLRNQRQQTKNTTLALKKLKYQFKSISSRILRSKTSQAAKQAAGQARREIMRLKMKKQSGDYDSEEIEAAINHAEAMERVAKKKAKHLEEEEMAKAAGGISQGEKVCADEESEEVKDAETEKDAEEEETMTGEDYEDTSYEDAYNYPGLDEFLLQTGDLMEAMSDFTSETMQELSDNMRDMMEEMGMDELSDTMLSVKKDMDPEDLKMMKIKHRNKEMKEIVKADSEYLKAVFNRLEKMKDNLVMPSGNNAAMPSGTSFSADAAGIGLPAVSAPAIDISL